MTNEKQQKPAEIIAGLFIIAAILALGFWGASSIFSNDDVNDTQVEQGEISDLIETNNEEKPTDAQSSVLESVRIPGFEEPRIVTFEGGTLSATFSEINGDISVTVTNGGSLDLHEGGFYNLERETISIEEVDVITAFRDGDEFAKAFSSLAFDFQIAEIIYSGEITDNVIEEGESPEINKLNQSLNEFISQIVNN